MLVLHMTHTTLLGRGFLPDLLKLYHGIDVPPERLLFKIPSTWQVCLDAELNGQNYVNLDIENANAYPPCLVDMDIEKGNSEAPKTNDEDVEKLKIEDPLTLILPSTKRGDCGSTLEVESTFTVYFAQPEPFVDGHNLTYNCYTYVE